MLKKIRNAIAALAVGFVGLVGTASAALTAADVDPVFAGIQTDATTLFTSALPVVGAILGLMIAIGLFKKMASKAG